MFASSSPDSPTFKPEDHLYNISLFEPKKSYDLLSFPHPFHHNSHQFSSWSDKDQEHFHQFNYRTQKQQLLRKTTAQSRLKRTSQDKLRISHSVTFHTNKIDLGARIPETPQKFTLKTKSQSMFVQSEPKTKPDMRKYLENDLQKNKQRSKLMQRLRQRMLQDETKKAIELETQPSYNVINYPISTVIRKRKYKKMEKCPFPSLAYRLSK